jgi:hypothetical protein
MLEYDIIWYDILYRVPTHPGKPGVFIPLTHSRPGNALENRENGQKLGETLEICLPFPFIR